MLSTYASAPATSTCAITLLFDGARLEIVGVYGVVPCPANRDERALLYPRVILPGAGLKPEYLFNPVPHQIAVEEFEHGLLLADRIAPGDDSGDDHIATAVVGE